MSLPPSSGWNSRPTSSSAGLLGKVTSFKLWLKSCPNVKFCRLFGMVTPSKLWSKSWPNVKFLQAAWQGHPLQALVEELAKRQVLKSTWQGHSLQGLVEAMAQRSSFAGCLERWIGTKADLGSSSEDSLGDEPSTPPPGTLGPPQMCQTGHPLPEQTLLLVLEALEESTMQDTNLLAHTYSPVWQFLPTIPCCSRLWESTKFASRCVNAILEPALPESCVETICRTSRPSIALLAVKLTPSPVKHSTWSSIVFGCIHIGSHVTWTPQGSNDLYCSAGGLHRERNVGPQTWETRKSVAGGQYDGNVPTIPQKGGILHEGLPPFFPFLLSPFNSTKWFKLTTKRTQHITLHKAVH